MSAFRFDRGTSTLDYINKQPTLGSITAHNCLTRDGPKLLVANYGMGEGGPDQSLVVFGFDDDGGLTPPVASVTHTGTTARMRRGRSAAMPTASPRPSPAVSPSSPTSASTSSSRTGSARTVR